MDMRRIVRIAVTGHFAVGPLHGPLRRGFLSVQSKCHVSGFMLLTAVACLVQVQRTLAQAPAPQQPSKIEEAPINGEEFNLSADAATASRIDQLIELLSSNEFAERKRAREALMAIGPRAFSSLRQAYHAADDFEVRSSIEQIVHDAYLDYHVISRSGYLGISHGPVSHVQTPGIPQGNIGFEVRNVQEGTGAQRAGLVAKDVIVALDGQTFQGAAVRDAQSMLGHMIMNKGPGTKITLTIIRDSQTMDIEATLGLPPAELLTSNSTTRIQAVAEELEKARRRFPTWWHKFFRDPAALDASR